MKNHVGDPFLLGERTKTSGIHVPKRKKQVQMHPRRPKGSFRDPAIKEVV